MALKIITSPAIEPVTLTQVKEHLRLESGSVADNISISQSITPGSYEVAPNYGIKGTGVDVLGFRTIVNLNAGTVGAGGTVDVKIQESDSNTDTDFRDWLGGDFSQVTEDSDNTIQEKEYTGIKKYIRAVATVAGASCEFGVDVVKVQPYSAEDGLLNTLITTAREYCEGFQNRAYIEQTWQLWMDSWPREDRIQIPLPPLVSVLSIKYYGTDDTEYTLTPTEYFVDTKSEPGRVVLGYGKSWPIVILRPANGVCIEFVAGYGATASVVPKKVSQAMLLLIGHWFKNREALSETLPKEIEFAVRSLLWLDRVVPL
jgi:uncharacterized phiE125 gp8 family phage protein